MTFAEGARWYAMPDPDRGGLMWALLPIGGLVFWHGLALLWCAHCAGMVHTGLAFVDAVRIVEQSATNSVDASSRPLKL